MLYLGIDQHARQITISLRNDSGDVVLARQVSTRPARIRAFFEKLTRERLGEGESFIAVLEVCGFNDWLIQMLNDYRCHRVILIQPEERKKRKTDRRDAASLSELLWVNRDRFLAGKPITPRPPSCPSSNVSGTVQSAKTASFDPKGLIIPTRSKERPFDRCTDVLL